MKSILVAMLLVFCIYPAVRDVARSATTPDNVITLRFWNGFTGPDGRTILRIVQKFSKENPDIHIIMQKMPWDQYYNKLFVAGVAGRCPEVFVIHSHTLPRFIGTKFVRQIDDLVGGPNQIDPSDFDPNVWAAMEHAGHHWAIPLDVHPLGMYYNRTLFRQAGIVDAHGDPKPPTNRAEFLDDLRRLKKPARDGHPDQWGFAFTWERTNTYAILRQYGGTLFNDSLTRSTLASPPSISAIQWCADLILKDKLVPSAADFDSWIGFRQGRIGMVFEGIYNLSDLQRQTDLDWGAAPMPLLGDQPATWAASHSLALRSDLNGKQLEAATRFIKFLSDNSLDWAEGGQVPVRRSLRNSDRFRAMYAQSEFAKQIPYVRYFPATPFVFEFLAEYDTAVELALRGSATPQDALTHAAGRIDAVIDRYRREGWEISR
ncbi:MAG TPA: ABC transporter substrate-binding protein [Tepidisphaeraceae bacterium]|nr:ABC transporter substrate-binding protein [Tepidisphaeraceae bacterium]